jgi:hypothetical protein
MSQNSHLELERVMGNPEAHSRLAHGYCREHIRTPAALPRMHELLDEIPLLQKRISLAKWHRVLGELCSMALAIPGARGLFSHLQAALRTADTTKRIRASCHVHATMEDFRWLASTLER